MLSCAIQMCLIPSWKTVRSNAWRPESEQENRRCIAQMCSDGFKCVC